VDDSKDEVGGCEMGKCDPCPNQTSSCTEIEVSRDMLHTHDELKKAKDHWGTKNSQNPKKKGLSK